MTSFIPTEAVAAVLGRPDAIRAVPLYLNLLVHALPSGTTIRTRERLADDLAVPEAEIDDLLGKLARAELVELRSPAPFLAIRLCLWPSRKSLARHSLAAEAVTHRDVPVSGSQQQQAAAIKQSGDGGPGEGVTLIDDARAVLGVSADDAEFQQLLSNLPEPLVRRALTRVRATPEREIRKSRLALFRYLLTKFHDESLTHDR